MSKEDSSGEGKSHASTPDTPANVPTKDPNADIYENRRPKKIIRVVTVMAYLFSVSFVGILLSAYYIFLWESPNPRLIERERLRTDPQLQYLVAPPSEEPDLTKKDSSFPLQSEVNHVHKPFLGRMAQDTYDGDDSVVDSRDEVNFQKKQRLNAILRKLRQSLVSAQRAQNRNSSQEAAIASKLNNSFVKMKNVLNTTVSSVNNTISRHGESRGNISEEKTYSDNADLSVKFADSLSMLNIKSTPSTSTFMTISGTETSQRYFHRDSVTNVNPIIEEKNRYHEKKLDAVESYPGFNNVTTNSDVRNSIGRRDVFGDNNSSKVIQKFLKTIRKESMKSNETDDHRLVNNDRKNDLGNIQMSVMLDKHVNGIKNSQENYSSDEYSKDQIARDRVSIDLSSRDAEFNDDPGLHQTPDDPTVVKSRPRIMGTRNFEETQIERMTARSTTIDNKQLEQIDLSTTQQKSLSEVFTEIADVEKTSVELTSISTMRDYHNFTSITNEDDDSVT